MINHLKSRMKVFTNILLKVFRNIFNTIRTRIVSEKVVFDRYRIHPRAFVFSPTGNRNFVEN